MAALAFGLVTGGVLVLGAGSAHAVTIVDQTAETDNSGVAVANTGGNTAVGNASDNDATNTQTAQAGAAGDDSVAVNIGSTGNSSDGTATIRTGDASATGNRSTTTHTQAVHTDDDGPSLVLVDQDSDVENGGVAIANTGDNDAVGNASDNVVDNVQDADAGAAGDDSVAVNIGATWNASDGTAAIDTGDAWAVGNASNTFVAQEVWTDDGFGGITIVDQDSDVDNAGLAVANTGFNQAAGNVSDNTVFNDQLAFAGAAGDDAVAVNFGGIGNASDGTAWIATGDAFAIGNLSATTVCQGVNTAPACPRAMLPGMPGHTTHPAAKHGTVPPPPAVVAMTTAIGGGDLHWHARVAGHGGFGGGALARTGLAPGVEVAAGTLLIGIGALLRRRSATA